MAGVKGKSGRKAKTVLTRTAAQIIMDAAPYAAQYLMKVVKGEVKRPSLMRVEACKFIINHVLGTPRQKVEMKHTGAPITYQELVQSAEKVIKEAEEVAKNYEERQTEEEQ